MWKDTFKLLRINQWVKNLLLFAPLVFAQDLLRTHYFINSLIAFSSFCLLSSCMYIVNDISDRVADRHHPVKKDRPLASGRVSVNTAWGLAGLTLLIGTALGWVVNVQFLLVAYTYLLVIISYSLWLKRIAILDIMIISMGFVLRAYAGSVAINVELSAWLIVTTLFLALFLTLGKRRNELVTLGAVARDHRLSLAGYSQSLLDQLIVIAATASLLSYTLYTLSEDTIERFGNTELVYTLPVVVYGLFRYFYLVYMDNRTGDPTEVLYTDTPILASVALWGVLVVAIIYF